MEQLSFKDMEIQELQAKIKSVTAELDRLGKEAARTIERKHFAAICDKGYSTISDVLNTNNPEVQKPFQDYMWAAVMIAAPEAYCQIVDSYIHQLTGCKPPEKQSPLTPEQKVQEYEKAIKQHNLEKVIPIL